MKKRKPCKCVDQVNKLLEKEKSNTRITTHMRMSADFKFTFHPSFEVHKLDPKKRGQPKTIFFAYCPICGKKR